MTTTRTRIALVSLALAALSACNEGQPTRWGHASTEPSSTFTNLLADSHSNTVTPYTSTQDLLAAVLQQEIEFALIEQPPAPIPKLSVVTGVFPSVLHILVRKELHDCSGAVQLDKLLPLGTIYAGTPGSTGDLLLNQFSAVGWLPDLQVLADPFGAEPDIFFQFGGILPRDAARRLGNYCLASIGDPSQLGRGSWAEGVSFRFPHLRPFILPAGLYPQLNSQSVLTLSVTSVLVTHADTDPELVYDIAQTVATSAGRLNEIYPLAGATIKTKPMELTHILPLHVGADRFVHRNAPSFLERYAELGALLLTAAIALTSAAFAILRMRQQRKKDRIDVYLSRLVELRQALRANQNNHLDVVQQVRALQEEVTELVVHERIEAGNAYVAFLMLSNQILTESESAA